VTLILVRHGRTAANAGGQLQGRLDLPLDDVGEQQVAQVAEMIGRPDRLVSSPLLRARQTAAAFDVGVEIDERWIEVAYGEWEGRRLADVSAGEWATWRADASFAPPGGESLADVSRRIQPALAELSEQARTEQVVVVSHVSPIKVAVAWALDVDVLTAWRCTLGYASVCVITIGAFGPSLTGFNLSSVPGSH
jgi:broad specificity phosphatase PhoE